MPTLTNVFNTLPIRSMLGTSSTKDTTRTLPNHSSSSSGQPTAQSTNTIITDTISLKSSTSSLDLLDMQSSMDKLLSPMLS